MNWGEIKDAVRAYTHRTDLDALFPAFLATAEQRIYYGEANTPALRVAAMQRCALVVGPRPSDYLAARSVLDSDGKPLDYYGDMTGQRRGYTWNGDELCITSDLDMPVTLHYWAKFAPLKNDTDRNWLTDNAPGIYLSSLLVEVARWSRDDGLGAREAANFASAVSALHSVDLAARHSGAPLVIRSPR